MSYVDRTGQIWLAACDGFDRHAASDEFLIVRGREPHPCLIVERPDLGAAHTKHPAIDLITGERCRLLEESDDTWEDEIAAHRRDGSLYQAPKRVT